MIRFAAPMFGLVLFKKVVNLQEAKAKRNESFRPSHHPTRLHCKARCKAGQEEKETGVGLGRIDFLEAEVGLGLAPD